MRKRQCKKLLKRDFIRMIERIENAFRSTWKGWDELVELSRRDWEGFVVRREPLNCVTFNTPTGSEDQARPGPSSYTQSPRAVHSKLRRHRNGE